MRVSHDRIMLKRWWCLLLVLAATTGFADEQVRQVQEELRKRNLFFGDVDGQTSADLANALKRYQARKGFVVTGAISDETATSLNVQSSAAPARWPDIPVLKSDSAPNLPEPQKIALQQLAEADPDPVPTPVPPGEQPSAAQDITPDRMTRLVEQYLRDSESNDIDSQKRYFAYPVTYFDHGVVGGAFVEKDVANYLKRWPERKYVLTEPVNFRASGKEGETDVEFLIQFTVRNRKYSVSGQTKNFWTIRPEGDDLKIISIREQRFRE